MIGKNPVERPIHKKIVPLDEGGNMESLYV
jgi:hypothetical protein